VTDGGTENTEGANARVEVIVMIEEIKKRATTLKEGVIGTKLC